LTSKDESVRTGVGGIAVLGVSTELEEAGMGLMLLKLRVTAAQGEAQRGELLLEGDKLGMKNGLTGSPGRLETLHFMTGLESSVGRLDMLWAVERLLDGVNGLASDALRLPKV